MTVTTGDISGTILILVWCVVYGLWITNRRHDNMCYTLTCPECKDEDIIEKGDGYVCENCGLTFKK